MLGNNRRRENTHDPIANKWKLRCISMGTIDFFEFPGLVRCHSKFGMGKSVRIGVVMESKTESSEVIHTMASPKAFAPEPIWFHGCPEGGPGAATEIGRRPVHLFSIIHNMSLTSSSSKTNIENARTQLSAWYADARPAKANDRPRRMGGNRSILP